MHFHELVAPEVVASLRLPDVDGSLATWFRAHLTPAFADVLLGFTTLGSEWWIVSLLLLVAGWMMWRRHWYGLGGLLLAVPCGSLLGEAIKWLVQRPRPFLAGPLGVWGGYSFPSGHTLAATLLYGFFVMMLIPLVERRRFRALVFAAGGLLIVTVAFSRVALGAHYLSDVLGAMLFGTLWLGVVTGALRLLRHKRIFHSEAMTADASN